MLAIVQDHLGGPEVLRVAEVPMPSPGPREILVRVEASGVNPTDWKQRESGSILGSPPFTLGLDVAGTVQEVGLGVTIHKPGDIVFGMLPHSKGGGYAQYCVGPARAFARLPVGVQVLNAACLGVVGLTSWQSLVDTADVGHRSQLLIHAGAGGVGHVAIQIAKSLGAYVVATASPLNHTFLESLGADEVYDYSSSEWMQRSRDIDLVVDPVGGRLVLDSLSILRPGGMFISLTSQPWNEEQGARASELGARTEMLLADPDWAGLVKLGQLCQSDELRVHVSDVFDYREVARAHTLSQSGHVRGKLALSWV